MVTHLLDDDIYVVSNAMALEVLAILEKMIDSCNIFNMAVKWTIHTIHNSQHIVMKTTN